MSKQFKRRSTFSNIFDIPADDHSKLEESSKLRNYGIIDQRVFGQPVKRKTTQNFGTQPSAEAAQNSFSYQVKRTMSNVGNNYDYYVNRSVDNFDDMFDSDGSQPSEHVNDSVSSLDDVCLPVNDEEKTWPDLKALQEFYDEERHDLAEIDRNNATLAHDLIYANYEPEESDAGSSQAVGFQSPIISKVDAANEERRPLLTHRRVNEVEGMNGRLRPPKILPWENSEVRLAEQFRFAYFREDMSATIHAPTISGLLRPGQTFADMFGKKHPQPATAETEASNAVFWLDCLNPTEDEMKVLSKAFGIHPLTTEDIFLGESREKVELFHDYYFICFRSFDIVKEKLKIRARKRRSHDELKKNEPWLVELLNGFFSKDKNRGSDVASTKRPFNSRTDELQPLNIYIIVFKEGILTFHFAPTPHPVNVRRRSRLLRDYLTVSSDWIAYALIDDITDSFGPMIEMVEVEVSAIEDEIIRMQSDSDDESEGEEDARSVFSGSTSSTASTDGSLVWQKKGDMLRRIGECRKKVMSLLRLLGNKADVIKGFAKKCKESFEAAPTSEIGMYLGDIQDHIITMVQTLNHCEKLLARSHLNYLAQINIDMTKVNNDTNDALGKITILGTIVLPMNVVTGLWGMNVIVPGQEVPGLLWFFSITGGMFFSAFVLFIIAKKFGVA